MVAETSTPTNVAFEAFKTLANILADPRLSFIAAVGALWVMIQFRRYVFNWIVGALVMMGLAIAILWGLKDPNFRLIVGKPDNVPITAMMFISVFTLWVAMAQAVNNDRRAEQKLPPTEKETSNQKTWVWPDLLYIEFIALIICSAILILWAIYLRAPLEEPANPSVTPNPSKAPWYFLGLQEMLVYYDPWYAGVVLPVIIIMGLCAIPYLDVNPKGNGYYTFTDRKWAITIFLFGYLALWVFMIVTGTFLRGPGWNFFGPFEYWDPHKVVALNNVNVSDYVWIHWLKKPLPPVNNVVPQLLPPDWLSIKAFAMEARNALVRESVGILFLLGYFTLTPLALAKTVLKSFWKQMDIVRYSIFVMLILTMGTLPLKMVCRWLFNLKYFVDTPWIKF